MLLETGEQEREAEQHPHGGDRRLVERQDHERDGDKKISNASHHRAADRLGDHPRRILDQSVHVEEA